MKKLTLFSRRGCHLCEVMQAAVERLAPHYRFTLEVIDIDRDPALQARYSWEVPVLCVDGERIATYRLDEAKLHQALEPSE